MNSDPFGQHGYREARQNQEWGVIDVPFGRTQHLSARPIMDSIKSKQTEEEMKPHNLFKPLLGTFTVLLIAAAGLAQPKGPTATVKGEVVDLWCYLEDGAHGAKHQKCGITCVKLGNPIGIVDADGNVYVLAGLEHHQSGQAVLLDKMSEEVTVTGILVKQGGTQMIYVKPVK